MPRKAKASDAEAPAEHQNGMPETIATGIRDLVARGVLAPGVHLGQMELAERFQTSRVPVREALKLLAAEGIINHDANRGFFVAPLSSDEARQLYRIRHLLEVELLASVEWPSKPQLAALRALLDELGQLLEQGKQMEWVARHREFHRSIFELSPKKVVVREVLRLLALTDRYRSLAPVVLTRGDRKVTQERHLLQALTNRDREKLLQVFEEDRTQIERDLLSILESRGL
jgi:DNA-binding GntR family transcriptional regulator